MDNEASILSNVLMCEYDLYEMGTVYGFLSENYLYWFEALSLVRDMPKAVFAVEKLYSLL